jgi:PAS domain S-box-containing protein
VGKLPIPENESQRLKALKGYGILDSLSEAEFDRITELASLVCDVPISLVSLIDENRQWFKSEHGLGIKETPRELAFCQYAIMGGDTFEVEDALEDERFQHNDLVTGYPQIRFYAGHPLVDPNGFALGTLCVIDRTPKILTPSQKRALQLLSKEVMSLIMERRQKEELRNFEKIFQLSNDLICIAGRDGFFIKVNPSFNKLLGWDTQILLKTSYYDLIHPDDLQKTRQELKKLAAGQGYVTVVHRFKAADGSYRLLEWTAALEPETGNIFAIARDITELMAKEEQLAASEERLRVFFENSQGLMCTHDMQGNFLSVNTAGAAILGYTSEEILKLSLFNIIPQERHSFLKGYLAEIREKGRSRGQMVTIHKNGSLRIWMFNNVLEDSRGPDAAYVIGNAIDITDRYYLENDLKRTKEMLEQTNKVARVGGWEADIAKQKVYWTSVTKELHGVAQDYEPDLNNLINFYKEGESRFKIKKALHQIITTGTPLDLELQVTDINGAEIWVRALGNAEFENGVCKRIYGAFQDIDEKKKALLELNSAKKLLDDVLEAASGVAIIATDKEGLITVFNTGAEKLLGYSASEMVGKQTPVILHVAEEVIARGKQLTEELGFPVEGFRVFTEKLKTQDVEQHEWTFVTKQGQKRIVTLDITAIRDLENNINGYLGIATDITQRKNIENALISEKARLSAFVENAPAGVAMFDHDMKYIAASNRWIEDYNLTGKQLTGISHYELFPEISAERRELHQKVMGGEIHTREIDTYIQPGTGKFMYISWEMRPWHEFDGTIGGIMMSTLDITSIIKQQEELKAAKILAEQASVAKSEFLANMSHEIRTPLNGVIGFTDLVLKTRLTEVQRQYLAIVNHSANSLLSIINDILDFSKIEAGKLELDIEKSDLYEMSCQAADIITYQVQTKGLEMLLNISPNLPRFIWVDSVRLKQIIINLLGNAAKFTESGEIELRIAAVASADDLTTIRFAVRDTGIGIKKEKQGKIFEAFSQEDGSTTKKYGGTGLGLTISNRLLGLMGSRLQLISAPGKGSTFFFDLAVKTEQGDPISWDNIDLIKTALIVDDNDNNRMILEQMLLLRNIHAESTKNGFEALQLLATGRVFNVILMDYHMPYMDGLETIRKIRESFLRSPEEQPIMLLHSSSDDARIIKACEDLKVSQRLVKPLKIQDLYNALSKLHKKEEENFSDTSITKNPEMTVDNITVLVAEDNMVNMLLVKTFIERVAPNATLLEAKNGIEAVSHCEKHWPDLVFMDVQMPEMNGYDATIAIRKMETTGHLPIIALTAGTVKGEREKCLAAGMDDFVVKPVVEETIAVVLKKWLNMNSEEAEAEPVAENQDEKLHYDLTKIKEFFGDDESVVTSFIALVKEELTLSAEALQTSFDKKDIGGLKGAGHKLYGTTVTAGMAVLSQIAYDFEHMDVFNEQHAAQLLAKAKAEITLVLNLMEKE